MDRQIEAYFATLGGLGGRLQSSGRDGAPMALSAAIDWAVARAWLKRELSVD